MGHGIEVGYFADCETNRRITPHELSIVELIAEGKSSREIAKERRLSLKTVETHRHNVMKRLKCRNTPHMIAILFREKLLF